MFLPDAALERLRQVAEEPDLSSSRYRILEPLGRGGMGVVYLAEDAELAREVALKVASDPQPDGRTLERLRREARVLARLEHPGVVPVHDLAVLPDGRIFYVMKRVRGDRLDVHLSRSALPLAERLRIFERVCEAVAFAHSLGVIHRDLKPSNVMIGAFGEVLVMDWGVAKLQLAPEEARPRSAPDPGAEETAPAAAREEVTVPGTVLGTPGYMAPEQERGEVDRIDRRTDVFALGGLLRFLLEAGGAAAPRQLAAVCRKAGALDPEDRYPDVEALAEEIGRHLSGEPVAAYREGPLERLARFYRRHQVAILLVLAYLLMRVLLFWLGGY